MKVSLPKLAGYKGDKSPVWDAILTFWLDIEVDQTYIDDMIADFSVIAGKSIAKLCNSVIVQEK